MKKLLSMVVLAGLFSAVSAFSQLTYIGGGVFEFQSDATQLTIKPVTNQGGNGQVTNFGYYFVTEDGTRDLIQIAGTNDKFHGVNPKTVEGEFNKGDKIGFYADSKKNSGAKVYSDSENAYFGKAADANGGSGGGVTNDYFEFGDEAKDANTDSERGLFAFQISADVADGGGDGTGRPLPGIFATIVLGGAAVAALRKKKQQKA